MADVLGSMGGPMNEAQKRLYKKLMKSLETSDVEAEEKRLADLEESPAVAFERKMELERRSGEMMRARVSSLTADDGLKGDVLAR
jgi:hypothetical protein